MSYYESEEIYDLEMEILELREQNKKLQQKLNKAKEVLQLYASGQHVESISIGSSYSIRIEDGTKAKETLKEIGDE